MSNLEKRLLELEKRKPKLSDESLYQQALDQVIKEATTEELQIAANSRKSGGIHNQNEINQVHKAFERRAKAKVRSEPKKQRNDTR